MSLSSFVFIFVDKSFYFSVHLNSKLKYVLYVFIVFRSCFYQKAFLFFSSYISALIAESCNQPDNENVAEKHHGNTITEAWVLAFVATNKYGNKRAYGATRCR